VKEIIDIKLELNKNLPKYYDTYNKLKEAKNQLQEKFNSIKKELDHFYNTGFF
jgi:flagellar capping protein FliD